MSRVLQDDFDRFILIHMQGATQAEIKIARRAYYFGANKVLGVMYAARKESGNQAVMTLSKMNAEVEAFVREELGGKATNGGLIV
jgi:hypothetical protein